MIHEINFNNYKAFKTGQLRIRPITILLGTNSAGKSSIIQLLLMLAQTFNSGKYRNNALKLNGDFVKLGENRNIFHNKKTNIPIEFSIIYDCEDFSYIYGRTKEKIYELAYSLKNIYNSIQEKEVSKNKIVSKWSRINKSIDIDISKSFDEIFKEIISLKRKINLKLNKISDKEYEKIVSAFFNSYRFRRKKESFYSLKDKKIIIDFKPLIHAFEFIKKINDLKISKINLQYTFAHNTKNNSIYIRSLKFTGENVLLLEYIYKNEKHGKYHTLKSDLLSNEIMDKYSNAFGKLIDLDKLIISESYFMSDKKTKDFFNEMLVEFLELTISQLMEVLSYNNINYINPLRAYPRRYYFQEEINNSVSINTVDLVQLIDIFKEKTEIKRSVNSWFKKFNLNIDIAQLEEVIHKIRVYHHGLPLDLTDVGFGISQVLPIIAQCYLAKTNSITFIEEPEIHLHPKMQADLADLFIETYKTVNGNKNFVIETHSEYFLKRLRRRISENEISSDDVVIYFVHPNNTNRTII